MKEEIPRRMYHSNMHEGMTIILFITPIIETNLQQERIPILLSSKQQKPEGNETWWWSAQQAVA